MHVIQLEIMIHDVNVKKKVHSKYLCIIIILANYKRNKI